MKNLLFLLILFSAVFTGLNCQAEDKRPNIIVILADDLGNADVGYHGQETEIPTPNIDKLAASGVSFTSGYVMAPVCGPSRAALLTGRYQQSFGFVDNPGPFRAASDIVPGVPSSVKIIPEYLKEFGYVTGMFGKWHLGGEAGEDDYFPSNRGFDEFFGFMDGASNYFVEENTKMTLFKQEQPVEYEPQYLTDALAREAIDYMERNQGNPFFLYLPFNAVHGPLQAPDSLINKFAHIANEKRRILCAMQYNMDKAIGQVMDKLDELKLSNNTLVFFISDNGGKIDGNYSYNTPYNGEKGNLYEGGIRLPFCIKWPEEIAVSTVYDKPVCAMDILPTILNVLGEDLSDHPELSGKNILPYIKGENQNAPHNYLYWWINNQWAVRDSVWKLVNNNGFSRPKLFNLANDIAEQNDLYDTNPEIVERLAGQWDTWRAEQMDIQWGWNSDIGDYVSHFEENWENIVKRYFAPMGSGVKVSIVENPKKEGMNSSNTVLKVVRPDENAPNWSGTWASVTQFQRKLRYLHIKMLKSRKSVVRAKLEGKNMDLVKTSMNAQKNVNEWEDFVFDFNDFTGPVTKINIQPDYEVGALHEIYIDDIHFSDDSNPITSTSVIERNGFHIYPNPAKSAVWFTLPPSMHNQTVRFQMYSMDGEQVKRLELSGNIAKKTVDCSGLNNGIYFVSITSTSQQMLSKLIIKN